MLNVTSKSENDTKLWVLIPKLESSRNLASKVISSCIKARNSKSTEQYDWKLFFRLDGTCNSMVELSNSTGWDLWSFCDFVISQGIPKLLLKILTTFRKVFVISQGIPKLLLKILTSFRKVFVISQGIPKVRNILTYLRSVYLWSSKGFQNFIWRFKFLFGGA